MAGKDEVKTTRGTIPFKDTPGTASDDIARPRPEDHDGVVTFFKDETAAYEWVHYCELF